MPGPNVLVVISSSISEGKLRAFVRGFIVSLTNAKTILFFGAFLPQFVTPESSFAFQISVLSATFWCLALAVNVTYMMVASKAATLVANERISGFMHAASGSLYLGAAAALSAIKR